MSAVRCPRRVLVLSVIRQLLHVLSPKPDGHDLKHAIDLRLKRDRATIRRTVGIGAVPLVTVSERDEALGVGAIRVTNIYLGMPEATRRERNAAPVVAECRREVFGAAPHGDAAGWPGLERR